MNRGGRGGFNRGGSSRGGFNRAPQGPPDQVIEMGSFIHPCEGDIVCRSTNDKIPYFNAPIYLENKNLIGKVDEILGPMNEVYFTVKPNEGIVATSFKSGDKFFIGPDRLLPIERFLPKPKPTPGSVSKKKKSAKPAGGRGGFSSSRGAPRGGGFRGGSRGMSKGGSGGFRGSRGGFGNQSRGSRGGRGGRRF